VQSGPRSLANPVAVTGHPNGTGISIIAADDLTLTGPVTVNSATSLGVTGGGIVRLTNTVGGTSSLSKRDGGTLALSGNNTFNGFTLESGLVVLGSSSTGGAGPERAGAVTVNPVNPNKGFRAEGADRTLSNPVTTYGDFFVDGPRHLTFTGPTTYYWPTGITVTAGTCRPAGPAPDGTPAPVRPPAATTATRRSVGHLSFANHPAR
jgi:autotransporter-associated beta strand protein